MEKKRRGILQFLKIGLLAVVAILLVSSNAQAVDFEFHGQYRVIYYYDSGTADGAAGNYQYVTHRFRPLFKASDGPWTGTLQLNYGWYQDAASGNLIETRLAYMTYTFGNGITLLTGRLPLGDKFDSMLFDACCTIVLATAIMGKAGNMSYRAGTGKAMEGQSNNEDAGDVDNNDDIDVYLFDVDTEMGAAKVGASFYMVTAGEESAWGDLTASWAGVRVDTTMGVVSINLDILSSSWETAPAGATDGGGMGIHLDLGMPVGDKAANLKVIYTTGDEDGEGFKTPCGALGALCGTYWGYTARLGGGYGGGFDNGGGRDGHNIGSDGIPGYGLMAIELQIKGMVTQNVSGALGAGMYTSQEEVGGETDIGTGFTAQVSRNLEGPFGVVAGLDLSSIGKALQGGGGADSYSVTSGWVRLQGAW